MYNGKEMNNDYYLYNYDIQNVDLIKLKIG